jgi:AmmeMemoRadiSam system protein B
MAMTNLRPAALAGQWYRANPQNLSDEVSGYIAAADRQPAPHGQVIGLIAPHAGHIYSGPVAGHAFATVQGHSYDIVAVLSPFHAGHSAQILSTVHAGYRTPLGSIPVDAENLSRLETRLAETDDPPITYLARDREHAIEIELPFLQTALRGEFSLLPLMLASFHTSETETLGAALADVLKGKNALLIASSDLSHFYPQETANRFDQNILDAVATFDSAAVLEVHQNSRGQACGLTSILSVMVASRLLGATRAEILNYDTSGTITGDYRSVVGYSSAAFLQS